MGRELNAEAERFAPGENAAMDERLEDAAEVGAVDAADTLEKRVSEVRKVELTDEDRVREGVGMLAESGACLGGRRCRRFVHVSQASSSSSSSAGVGSAGTVTQSMASDFGGTYVGAEVGFEDAGKSFFESSRLTTQEGGSRASCSEVCIEAACKSTGGEDSRGILVRSAKSPA